MNLTSDEKIRLVTGSGTWRTSSLDGKLESLYLCDGPHGIRKEQESDRYSRAQKATCFPTASSIASSWNTEAVKEMGEALAKEAINKEVSILLGPGVNIKRSPLCGRNFEYFSEDPYLSGKLAESYINAVQSMGVGTSLKHFAGNNQESNRQTANSQIDERALREIYLRAFEIAVKGSQPSTIMHSYNRINGNYAGESRWLLTDILRNEWGFEGAVVSDWGATIRLPECIAAGLDLEMPDSHGRHGQDLKKAIEDGVISTDALDRAVEKILDLTERYSISDRKGKTYDISSHHDLARRLASESAVLLKNNGLLPLDGTKDKELVVIGALAKDMRFQGGGSSNINADPGPDAVTCLKNMGFKVTYAKGYVTENEKRNEILEDEAVTLAKSGKKVLFFGGLTEIIEGEGFDRAHMRLPENQAELMKKITEATPDLVYVSFSGAPYEMPFEGKAGAILQMYLAGEASGEACVDILTGRVNPSGKLAETWPKRLEDVMSTRYFDTKSRDLQYRESLFVGYRYFDSYTMNPMFEFGKGLSYTEFRYSDLKVLTDENQIPYAVTLKVKNTGKLYGKEAVQIYIKNPPCKYLRARRELKGFNKIALLPSEEKTVEIRLDDHAFTIFDDRSGKFIIPSGEYIIEASASIKDIRCSQTVYVRGVEYERDDREIFKDYFTSGDVFIYPETFEKLYGKPLSHFDSMGKGEFTLGSSLEEMSEHSLLARTVKWGVVRTVYKMFSDRKKDDPHVQMMVKMAATGPIDAVISESGSPFMARVGKAVVEASNGHGLKALGKLIGG